MWRPFRDEVSLVHGKGYVCHGRYNSILLFKCEHCFFVHIQLKPCCWVLNFRTMYSMSSAFFPFIFVVVLHTQRKQFIRMSKKRSLNVWAELLLLLLFLLDFVVFATDFEVSFCIIIACLCLLFCLALFVFVHASLHVCIELSNKAEIGTKRQNKCVDMNWFEALCDCNRERVSMFVNVYECKCMVCLIVFDTRAHVVQSHGWRTFVYAYTQFMRTIRLHAYNRRIGTKWNSNVRAAPDSNMYLCQRHTNTYENQFLLLYKWTPSF